MLTEIRNMHHHYFIDDKHHIQGEYKRFHYWSTNLFEHCFLVDGEIQGEYKRWWVNGQIAEHSFYHHDKRNGEYKEWRENGSLSIHCFYVNGKVNGEYKSYDINNKLYKHCFIVDNMQVSFDEILYPATLEDRMYFMLKYNIQLLTENEIC